MLVFVNTLYPDSVTALGNTFVVYVRSYELVRYLK